MGKEKYDLTQGGIFAKLLTVSLPIMGSQLTQMAYNLTDMFWLGRVGSDAVAATGTAGMYAWLAFSFMLFGRMGAEIGVAQSLGRGNEAEAEKFAHNSFVIAVVLGALYTSVMIIFASPLIGFFQIREASVFNEAVDYLRFTALGFPLGFIGMFVLGVFTGRGNTRIPFFVNLFCTAINVVLDPVLIFTLDLGVMGAAYATVFSQAVSFGLSLWIIRWSKFRPLNGFRFFQKPELYYIKKISKWCIPISIENFLFCFLSMTVNSFVSAWGASAIAAARIGSQIESLSWLISGGFSSATTSFIGQNYGAGLWTRIRKGFTLATLTMASWGAFTTLLIFFGGHILFYIFLPDAEALSFGVVYLRIFAFCQIASCVEATTAGCFRGIGKTLPPSIVSITINVLSVPVAYFLSQTELGLSGIWWAMSGRAILRGVVLFGWYMLANRKYPAADIETS